MIKDETLLVENYWVEGMEVSNPSPLTLVISEGKFYIKTEAGIEEDVYPAFTFDVEADHEFSVIYDVYLLDLPSKSGESIHVDRTEIGGEMVPYYSGEDATKYLLMTFEVPPNTTDLKDIPIRVRRAVLRDDNGDS